MPYISYSDLETVFVLLEKEIELCGFLLEGEINPYGALLLYVDSVGNANSCQHSKYMKYIWHTHPRHAKPYPSEQDIVKVLKQRSSGYPENALMFSTWGVWEMSAKNKLELDDNQLQKLLKIAKEGFYGLYHITERARGDLNDTTLGFLQNSINQIVYNINAQYNFEFSLAFTPWYSLKRDSSYFLKL